VNEGNVVLVSGDAVVCAVHPESEAEQQALAQAASAGMTLAYYQPLKCGRDLLIFTRGTSDTNATRQCQVTEPNAQPLLGS
jgi:hypothetical protein